MSKRDHSRTIWIDLENSPHVPFFVPIAQDLERRGWRVIFTARDFAQTKELVRSYGLDAKIIGREYGDRSAKKIIGILLRAFRLAMYVRGLKPALAVGHGSRGLVLASKLLRIPSLTLYDYEGASVQIFNRLSTWVMTPEAIPFRSLQETGLSKRKHLVYHGLKEDVYINDGIEAVFRSETPIDPEKIIVTIRPPSHTAHYKSEESFALLQSVLGMLAERSDVQTIIVPRTDRQRDALIKRWGGREYIVVLRGVVSGHELIEASDLIIGGGGTINREAAALSVPVVTIFKGPMGAVDRWLIESGKMVELKKASEIEPLLKKRARTGDNRISHVREEIVSAIVRIAEAT